MACQTFGLLSSRPSSESKPASFQVSDELWEALAPLLPQRVNTHPLGGGRPRVPDRTCANGIFYVLRTGPVESVDATGICSGSTAHLRFQEWVAAGVFLVQSIPKVWEEVRRTLEEFGFTAHIRPGAG